MRVRQVALTDGMAAPASPSPPPEPLAAGLQGYMLRSVPVAAKQPRLALRDGYLCYVPSQYEHCFIDLRAGFGQYRSGFSSRTRSTINRKVARWVAHCGGEMRWRRFTSAGEMPEFHRLARQVAVLTYQERLLDAALPGESSFLDEMCRMAAEDRVRAFLLFDGERPVSYLYCPATGDTLIYAYLGYDPDYAKFSVGTVLQWVALESIFAEGRFRYFDFTEGDSQHKRLFSTGRVLAANVLFVRPSLRNRLLIRAHSALDRFSSVVGSGLERIGLKSRIRRLLRAGA